MDIGLRLIDWQLNEIESGKWRLVIDFGRKTRSLCDVLSLARLPGGPSGAPAGPRREARKRRRRRGKTRGGKNPPSREKPSAEWAADYIRAHPGLTAAEMREVLGRGEEGITDSGERRTFRAGISTAYQRPMEILVENYISKGRAEALSAHTNSSVKWAADYIRAHPGLTAAGIREVLKCVEAGL
jgi:hypothetical protein